MVTTFKSNAKSKIRLLIRSILVYIPFTNHFIPIIQRFVYKLRNKTFEADFEILEKINIPNNSLLLDIGGNIGFGIDAISKYAKMSYIISFEPNPLLAKMLRNRYRNNTHVEIQQYGLGDKPGNFILYVPVYRQHKFNGLASFKYEHATSWLSNNELYFYNKNKLKIMEYQCFIKTMDEMNLSPFFIKIDVQGYEELVLLGGINTIRNNLPIIMIEGVTKSILKLLSIHGYNEYQYDAKSKKLCYNSIGNVNSILIPDKRIHLFTDLFHIK